MGWDRKSGLKMVWAAENMVSFTERGRKCSKFVKCIERLLIKKYMWNTHIKNKCQRDWHLVEYTGKLTPHFSPSHKKKKTLFLLWKFQCNELSTFYQRKKKSKIKGFPDSIALCSFRFEFLNLPEMLREFGVEAFERHFIRSLHQIHFSLFA